MFRGPDHIAMRTASTMGRGRLRPPARPGKAARARGGAPFPPPRARLSWVAVRPRFHLAIPVSDLAEARAFYGGLLGCPEGRSSERWVDFDLHGHQLVAHLAEDAGDRAANPVDGDAVPVPHFGLILEWEAWEALAARLRAGGAAFVLEPRVRFRGAAGEQGTFFVRDPSGNALEFKTFRDDARVFARDA